MPENVVYIAIFENEKMSVTIEYLPLQNGAIEIVSASIQQKPVPPWQERQEQRRGAGKSFFNILYESPELDGRTDVQ